MHLTSTAESGEVNADTIFEFSQEDSLVSARYSGGGILLGYLVGILLEDTLQFQYAQVNSRGRLDGGHSTCEISKTANGRLQLHEHFKWASREGSGTNVFEEIVHTK
jgi:hypothetical protein